jgi:hypothetical protein
MNQPARLLGIPWVTALGRWNRARASHLRMVPRAGAERVDQLGIVRAQLPKLLVTLPSM